MTDVTLQIFDLEKETIRSVSLDMESDVELVQYIAWLPEGEGWIAAGMASEAPGYRVWKIDPTGKAKRAFASPSDWLYLPQVSDDGTQLAIAAKAVETQLMILEPPR